MKYIKSVNDAPEGVSTLSGLSVRPVEVQEPRTCVVLEVRILGGDGMERVGYVPLDAARWIAGKMVAIADEFEDFEAARDIPAESRTSMYLP